MVKRVDFGGGGGRGRKSPTNCGLVVALEFRAM